MLPVECTEDVEGIAFCRRDCLLACLSPLSAMWLLAHALGYHQMRLGYSDGCRRADDMSLDEIAVAGVLCIVPLLALARSLGVPYAVHALLLISDPLYFIEQIRPPCQPENQKRSTAEKWQPHLSMLVQWGVIRNAARGCVKYVHKYFAVSKSCGTLARAIFNGRAFSSATTRPRSVNLPDLAELLQVLSSAFQGKRFSFMCADWRHWFFQFPVHPDIQNFFGIRLLEKFFVMRVLPMGWSHSPLVAQSAGWLIVLEALRRCKVDIHAFQNQVQLPPYLRIDHGGVLIVVALWYDNLGVFSTSENFVFQYTKQFRAVCADFKATIKELHVYSQDELDLRNRPEEPVDAVRKEEAVSDGAKPPATYLGMEVGWRLDPQRHRSRFEWRHALARRRKWWQSCGHVVMTCRSVSHLVGVIVWNSHIRLEPLAYVKCVIDILRVALSKRNGWDKHEPELRDDLERLTAIVRTICLDSSWIHQRDLASHRTIYAASDASSKRWGYIVYDVNLEEIRHSNDAFDQRMYQSHIFVKELLAAVLAIEWCCQNLGSENSIEIVIAVDNTAAAGVLRRLYSTTKMGDEMVRRVLAALDSRHILRVMTLRSEDNPSDPLTRNRPMCSVRNTRFHELVGAYKVGRHITALPKANPHRVHTEQDDAQHEFSSDDDANVEDEDEAFLDDAYGNAADENARTEDDASAANFKLVCGPSE